MKILKIKHNLKQYRLHDEHHSEIGFLWVLPNGQKVVRIKDDVQLEELRAIVQEAEKVPA